MEQQASRKHFWNNRENIENNFYVDNSFRQRNWNKFQSMKISLHSRAIWNQTGNWGDDIAMKNNICCPVSLTTFIKYGRTWYEWHLELVLEETTCRAWEMREEDESYESPRNDEFHFSHMSPRGRHADVYANSLPLRTRTLLDIQ